MRLCYDGFGGDLNKNISMGLGALIFFVGVVGVMMFTFDGEESVSVGRRGDVVISNVEVSDVDLLVMESFPVQVNAVVKGQFFDSCSEFGEVSEWRDGNVFGFVLNAQKPHDADCDEGLKQGFEEVIDVPVLGLEKGEYVVEVNGVREVFELSVDNVPYEGNLEEFESLVAGLAVFV